MHAELFEQRQPHVLWFLCGWFVWELLKETLNDFVFSLLILLVIKRIWMTTTQAHRRKVFKIIFDCLWHRICKYRFFMVYCMHLQTALVLNVFRAKAFWITSCVAWSVFFNYWITFIVARENCLFLRRVCFRKVDAIVFLSFIIFKELFLIFRYVFWLAST